MVAVRTDAADEQVDDVDLATRARGGDGAAFAELFDRWFDRAYDVAWHIVRNRDTAADVAQDTFATAWQSIGTLRRPDAFGGWVLRIARNKALNRLAADQRARPVGDEVTLAAHDRERRTADDPADPVTDRERDDLVWAAAAALGDDDASILSLHLRHGLTAAGLAEELGIAANAAHQRLFRLRKRLGDAIGAWALWHLGHPRCDDLRRLLAAAGTTRFDRDAAGMITAHSRGCPDCTDRRALRLSPEALFAATPLVVAGPMVKAEAAAALTAAGTPAKAAGGLGRGDGGGEVGDGGGGGEGGPGDAPGASGWAGRGLRVAAMGAVAALVVAVVLVLGSHRSGEEPELLDATAPTSTTGASSGSTGSTGSSSVPTTADPATTAPATAPVVTAPPTSAGSVAPPTAPPDPGPEPEPEPPAPAPPVIGGFRAVAASGTCATPSQSPTTFVWDSTGATSARLQGSAVEPSGTHTACAVPGTTWTLTVANATASTSATVTVPPPAPAGG
ncbi:MAG TPA: sigma-70 family RNA polymerase sigma factor [Acidimicrobiales bacterium]